MSNGLDSLANVKAPEYLMNILESKPDMTYQGQQFTGDLMQSNVTNIENSFDPMMVLTDMFGADADSTKESGLTDRDAQSTFVSTGDVKNDND